MIVHLNLLSLPVHTIKLHTLSVHVFQAQHIICEQVQAAHTTDSDHVSQSPYTAYVHQGYDTLYLH